MHDFENGKDPLRRTSRVAVRWAVLLLAALPSPGADDAAAQAREAQRKSVLAMQGSIARQRAATAGMRTAPLNSLPPAPVPSGCGPLPREELDGLIAAAVAREGLTPDLLRAVIGQESSFQPCAVSPKGAMGLMQLMPATALELGLDDPLDPRQNVEAGSRYLKQLLDRFGGNLALALGAYNAGPARVEEAGGVPAIPETARYVRQILSLLAAGSAKPD
jgi:soluble lytic murein transglycosylase-like protein